MRRWELVSDGSAKFWEIAADGAAVTVRFGRIGTSGQSKTKELASAAAAAAHVAKLVAEKEKKGYLAVPGSPEAEPVATPAPEPATAAAADAVDSAPAPASHLSPPDEDTWVMPREWLDRAMRHRDARPLPGFAVDPALVREFRDRVAASGEKIAEALEHPSSDGDLVRALRGHLAGTPDPLGAAALAEVAGPQVSPVHSWIDEFGLPFAAVAAVHHAVVDVVFDRRDRETAEWVGVSLRRGSRRHHGDDTYRAAAMVEVRTALAVADQATYAAAEAALEPLGGDAFTLAARAFLVPTRHDWFEEANAAEHAPFWMVLCAASTLDQLARLRVGPFIWSPVGTYTALHLHGPALAPLLDANLRSRVEMGADARKLALTVLAALPSDEAFLMLLDRVRERYVRPALRSALTAFPARAARLLATRAETDVEARNLLRQHLMSHPRLELPAGLTWPEVVPDAPAASLPRVLAAPPWEHRRPQPEPVVLKDVPVPAARLDWLPGEREEWSALSGWAVRSGSIGDLDWLASRHDHPSWLFESAPEDAVRPLLADWVPPDAWGGEEWGRRIVARFGVDALPPMVRLAASSPQLCGVVLLPFAAAEVAGLMADWFVRLKSARAFAVSWLARHRETAARLLLPAALGVAGPARRNAELALLHLHFEVGVDVVAVAAAVSPEVEAAVRTLIEVDPLDVLPAKLPVIGDWADPRLLPPVLVADRSAALSFQAARNLLMTAALSKPDSVYPGLPQAVEACDRASLAEFAWAVLGSWQDVEAPAKDSWVLSALGWFGDDETVRRLAPLIRVWPGESQHARAVAGLDVLATIGTETALTHLNTIAERVKFKGLQAKAQEKVTQIAAELGLSRDQLADRLVPRLGLDDAATSVIDYGPRRFTVGFDEQLKPYVLDQDGKLRKDLPKPGAKDDQELAAAEHKRFAALKKDVRGVASDQIHRLERAMIDQRTWTAEEFHTVLAGHPLLWHIVRRLVWVTDDGESFRLAEDRTLADAADDEYALPPGATVRVAHPVTISDTLKTWGDVFADYEILQPFPQLGRPTYAFTPGEDVVPQLRKYVQRPMPVGRLLGLTKRGWERCTPQDNGVEPWMTRPLPSGGALVACVDPGIVVGVVDMHPTMTFESLWYSATGNGDWSAPSGGGPATFDIDPVTASELLSELESLHA
ncbi:WGR domain-containing protein, predicted DNA-binding domain in MolR [Lentzea fradiae]|uniref:WGR domain-containing protein, predicted DNA-binding domain in MolR n=1 Tax=Lentzea fradiae TaxID=200378 RepID=A0A1G7KC87_9PSEU|nr:DUF4132 domain-containing protein [Lentzea fradiae]SDF34469.1 WGR domain-containing protein, predicted DNA-binding domain in MolR [Lentzea fradiae]